MSRTSELLERGARVRTDGSNMTGEDARALIASSLGTDPYERIEALREAGDKKAEAEGLAYQMERQRKSVLASIASEIAQAHASQKMSEAKLDRLARADNRYKQHIDGTAQAIEAREKANAEYWAIRATLEWDAKAVAHVNALSRIEGTL